MLSQKQRLVRASFGEVFSKGSLVHTSHFLIRTLPSPDTACHGAVVVPKRVLKQAIDRHRLKRRVYAVLEKGFAEALQPIDIVVVAKRGAGTLSFSDIQNELASISINNRP